MQLMKCIVIHDARALSHSSALSVSQFSAVFATILSDVAYNFPFIPLDM